MKLGSALDFYIFNACLGPSSFRRGLDFFRTLENSLVYKMLEMRSGLQILDIGTGTSILPLYLAAKHECRVCAVDLQEWLGPLFFGRLEKRFQAVGIQPHCFTLAIGDARRLPYPDNAFDRVYALSSIEHIPGDGDSFAAQEMARVLKPGGIGVLTVPFGSQYQRGEDADPVFGFMRRYDDQALQQRLIVPAGLTASHAIYFGEPHLRFSNWWYMIVSSPFADLVKWAIPPIAAQLLLRCSMQSEIAGDTGGVCLALTKSNL